MESDPKLTTREKLNLETAKINWSELQRFFAQGRIVVIDTRLDLVAVATDFVEDNGGEITALLEDGRVRMAQMDDATRWNERDETLWAVVTAPWILVQEQQKS